MKAGSIIGAVCGAIFRVAVVIFAAYAIFHGATLCYEYGYRIFTEPAVSAGEGRTVTVAVTPEMSASDIGKLFESKGLVRDAKLFVLQYYLSEYRKEVEPGVFELSTAMTTEEMMAVMAENSGDEDEDKTGGSGTSETAGEGGSGADETGAEEDGSETGDEGGDGDEMGTE